MQCKQSKPEMLHRGLKIAGRVVSILALACAPVSAQTPASGSAPSGLWALKATEGVAEVSLSWSAVPGATYDIFVATKSNGESLAAPTRNNIAGTTITVSPLAIGTPYFFKVQAIVDGSVLATSNEATATPRAILAPSALKAVAGIGQVTLSWQAAKGAVSYNVYEGTKGGGEATAPVQTKITATSTTVSGLPNGSPLYFQVHGVAADGTVSDASDEQVATPRVTASIVDLAATAGDSQVTLTWTPIGATNYEVDVATSPTGASIVVVMGIAGGSYTVPKLQDGNVYFFVVKAFSASAPVPSVSNQVWVTPSAIGSTADAVGSTLTNNAAGVAALKLVAQKQCPQLSSDEVKAAATTSEVILVAQAFVKRAISAPDDVVQCNKWLARYTVAIQTQSSTSSIQAFPQFNASIANNSQLVTTHFVSAFIPMWLEGPDDITKNSLDWHVNSHAINDIGIDISSSVPISSATLAAYASQELLTRSGGLVNLDLSLAGRNYANEAYAWGNRAANIDRLYWIDLFGKRQPATANEALGFISQGLIVKALKTTLTGTNGFGAQGTLYAGAGFDGPMFNATGGTSAGQAGMMSLEVFMSENWVSGNTLNSMLGTSVAKSDYPAWGVNLQLYVTNKIGIQVQYSDGLFSQTGRAVGHVAMLTVGYNNSSNNAAANSATTGPGPATNAPAVPGSSAPSAPTQ